jgi:flagellar basal body-associated protein FliL
MADEAKDSEQAEDGGGKGGVLPYLIVGVLCTGVGVAVPFLLPTQAGGETEKEKPPPYELPVAEETVFVPFGDVSVNLDDSRMTRFLKISVTLQVAKDQEQDLLLLLESKNPVLKNWLLSHLSDKDLEAIRGAAGQNRLRREIRDHFNTVLYPDGYDRIYDVLFDTFAIQ